MSRAHTNFPHDKVQKDPHAPAHDMGGKKIPIAVENKFLG